MTDAGRWAARAAALYTTEYAKRYRSYDDTAGSTGAMALFVEWIRTVSQRFEGPIDVLDLGCGTGRYFRAVAHARRLVGIDVSRPMLDEARHPAGLDGVPPGWLVLIEDDFLVHEFQPDEFDLIYSVGVLAEHSPFDAGMATRVKRWLKPGGRFAFTTVHPLSPSVPRTWKRRAGESLLSVPSPRLRQMLRDRLMRDGLYADEGQVQTILTTTGFTVESIELFDSDVHRHVLAVARKGTAE